MLGNVVDIFTNMDMGDAEAGKDLLGRTYEYCIAQFAAYEGVKGGEFYTPASIVKTIVAILKPFDNCRVYDPCCGSGGMFVQSVKFLQAHSGRKDGIAVYGQESNADTWKMAKINMAIRGIEADFGPHQADTFFNDLHPSLKADFIMANPPFNLSNWGQAQLRDDVRWKYGLPPAGNANYAWIQHMIHHLAPDGKIGLVLANGSLSTQSSGEGEIRKTSLRRIWWKASSPCPQPLLQRDHSRNPLVHQQNKRQKGKTLFIDARKWEPWSPASTATFQRKISKSWPMPSRPSRKAPWRRSGGSASSRIWKPSNGRTTSSPPAATSELRNRKTTENLLKKNGPFDFRTVRTLREIPQTGNRN